MMKPLLSNWTVVLAGRWNMEILNPEWVAQNIFQKNNIDVDLVLDGMRTNIRYRFDNLVFVPRRDNVTFSVNDASDGSLQAIESAACKLLESLPVTPIAAFGINFTYREDETPLALAKIFNVSDSAMIAKQGFEIKNTRVRREILFEGRHLNLIISQIEGTATQIALNFHHPVLSTGEALEKLQGSVVGLRHKGEAFLEALYGLKIEEENHE